MTGQDDHSQPTGSDGPSALEHLSRLAVERRVRVGVAESLTSGRLASTVGAGDDASDWFAGASWPI